MNQQAKSVRKPKNLRMTAAAVPAVALNGLALSLSTAMWLPAGVHAQTAAPQGSTTLPTVRVQESAIDPNPNAEVGVPYKAKTSADERHTRPLAETPQTIQVLTKKAIDESGYTDLKQILSSQPGITLGTGENGNAFGDRYIIRGQEARSDVFVDGLRDPGMTTRESFAVEQLEISKGPNSSFAGRGTAGGAVNAATKQATLDYSFAKGTFALGSDSHKRFTVDTNYVFSDTTAVRLNALYGNEDVPGRSPSERDRKGLALSALYKPTQDLDVVVDYYGLRAKDKKPDIGSFLVGTSPYRLPAEKLGIDVPVYAQASDVMSSDVDTLTARVSYRISPDARLVSRTRFGTADNAWITTGASYGASRSTVGGTPFNAIRIDGGHTGWQDVQYFAHQSNLLWNTNLGGMRHEFVGGVELTNNKATFGNYSLNGSGQNCSTNNTSLNAYCITDASGALIPNYDSVMNRNIARNNRSRVWEVRTLALSIMDTVDLTDKWTAFAGLRADHYKFSLDTYTAATGVRSGGDDDSDTLFNGHFGLTYKINPMGIVYASVATATDINGGESDSSGVAYGGAILDNGQLVGKPERSKLFEIGTKWNVLDDKLLFTAAAFRTNKSNVLEAETGGTTGYETLGANTGANRVQGLEFGLVGNVTEKFTVQAGVAFMKSKVTKSLSSPATIGAPLANFADRSASLQMKYQVTDAFAIGGAAKYQSSVCGGSPDQGAPRDAATGLCTLPVPSFTKYDLFATYRINKAAELRFNVLNVTDKEYYTAVYRSGNFLYKGDGRAYRLTLSYDFF